eukprot:Pgem_evm1s1530
MTSKIECLDKEIEKIEKHSSKLKFSVDDFNKAQTDANQAIVMATGPTLALLSPSSLPTTFDRETTMDKLMTSMQIENDKQQILEKEVENVKTQLALSQNNIFGSPVSVELEKWREKKLKIAKLCQIITYLIEFQEFKTTGYAIQYQSLCELTKSDEEKKKITQEIKTLEGTLLTFANDPSLANILKVKIETLKKQQLTLLDNQSKAQDTTTIPLSTFVSRRTTLLSMIKKFSPEKLVDKEFLQNIGMLGIYYGTLEENDVIKPLQQLTPVINSRRKVFVIESGQFGGDGGKNKNKNKNKTTTNMAVKYCVKQNITNNGHLSETEMKNEMRRFYRQCYILKDLKHPNIINIVAAFEGIKNNMSNSLCMVMPYYNNGDLGQWIKENPSHTRLLSICYPIIDGILHGLKHIHEHNIVHNDIKPENVFLNDNLQPIIGDFDDAKEFNTGVTQTLPYASFRYIAPEIKQAIKQGNMMNVRFNDKTDMYAFGILVEDLLKDVEMTTETHKKESESFINSFAILQPEA